MKTTFGLGYRCIMSTGFHFDITTFMKHIRMQFKILFNVFFQTLSRGSVNNYIMSVSEWLGPLTFIRVWHDSSGKGKNQGWYLSKVIVTDLQTGET